jgi:hypothetical protein
MKISGREEQRRHAGGWAVKWLATWWRGRAERPRGAQRCGVCAGFEAAIWELQQRGYPTAMTEDEYGLHRLEGHPVSREHAGPQPLTYTRTMLDNDAA